MSQTQQTAHTGLITLVMAAGKGTRMHSDKAKVLHPLCGRPMIRYVVETAQSLASDRIIVIVGHQAETVKAALQDYPVEFVEQRQQLGTGHAVMQARPLLEDYNGTLLVLAGDTPLIQASSLQRLVEQHRQHQAAVTILTARMDNPFGLGRIVRDTDDQVLRIIEEKDATPEERRITEVNSSTYCFHGPSLLDALIRITPDNKQGEYYLTDTIALLREQGGWVAGSVVEQAEETLGINTPDQLADAEQIMRARHQL